MLASAAGFAQAWQTWRVLLPGTTPSWAHTPRPAPRRGAGNGREAAA